MRKLTLLIAAIAVSASLAAKDYTLESPDKSIRVSISDAGGVSYSVERAGTPILAKSCISMTLADGTVFGAAGRFKATKRSVDVTLPVANFKRSSVRDNFNELKLSAKKYDIVFRAYDDGVAYRFISKCGKAIVKSEQAEFNFAEDWPLFVPYVREKPQGSFDEQYFNSFENTYAHHKLSEWQSGRLSFLPLTVEAKDGVTVCVTESDLDDYPGMFLFNGDASSRLAGVFAPVPDKVEQGGHNQLQGMVKTRKDFIAECEASRAFPWRVVAIVPEARLLAQSDLTWRLGAPAEERDWSWVKPGKVAWDWWNAWNIYGVDFEAGINNDTYKYYIDFAAANGIEYVILDEGWAVKKQADLMQVIPEIDLPELCAYAEKRNVGLILWAGYWAFNRDMEGVCKHYS
ncbi:MAG: glycoside hydrolase family 97 N-terminal domain-containing protein, partial [Bacteroidales bacterium]|nr:glycoside hydrolase family 97 N-terminal domain-containing protein [Bacteroidales bacterium]